MRRTEAAELRFKDIDLDHETIALDENKTDNPRWWKLSPGVADALRAWRDLRNAEDGPSRLHQRKRRRPRAQPPRRSHPRALGRRGLTRADLTSNRRTEASLRPALLPPLLRDPVPSPSA